MSTVYTPRAGTLAAQVCNFFRNNPGEVLTLEDITAKFDCGRSNVHTQLGDAKAALLLKRERDADGEYIYSAGPELLAPSSYSAPAAQAPAKKPARGGFAAPRKTFDLDAVVVEDDVPLHYRDPTKGQNKWLPLFAKLQKKGQSMALPGDLRGAVGAAAGKLNRNKAHGATYRVAMDGADKCRVWRTA